MGASIGDRPGVPPPRLHWLGRGIHEGIGGALHAVSEAQKSLLKLLLLLLEELLLLQELLFSCLC